VSFYLSENTDPRPRWARDSETLVTFDPSDGRCGGASDPHGLVPALEELGFDVWGIAGTILGLVALFWRCSLTGVRIGRTPETRTSMR
jgi:hypothetical protein